MGAFTGGVFPAYLVDFKIGTKGLASTESDMKNILDLESFTPKIAGKTDSWYSLDQKGWQREIMTGKAFSMSFKGKRHIGDPGNDYIAITAWADGLDCSSIGKITFPDGTTVTFNCVVDVTNPGADDGTKVAPLEFELKSDGKPTVVEGNLANPAAIALSSSNPTSNATGVAINIQPVLTFNNAIRDYSNITLLNETDNSIVAYTASIDVSNKIVTIAPSAALTAGKKYDIILAGVTDIYGQKLANTIISFTC